MYRWETSVGAGGVYAEAAAVDAFFDGILVSCEGRERPKCGAGGTRKLNGVQTIG